MGLIDYIYGINSKTYINIVGNALNLSATSKIQPVYYSALGLAFNNFEVVTNANANVWFINYLTIWLNNDANGRSPAYETVAGVNIRYQDASLLGVTVFVSDYILFQRLRFTNGAGLIINAATGSTFIGLRIQI